MAALLHDIGKVGVPDEILHKADALDAREWAIMREYPVIGERIIRAIPGMGAIARIVRHQHERFDGNGYPDGLAGDEIPIEARIILVCDAYHAMTSDRPYREQLDGNEALAELTANAGGPVRPRGRRCLRSRASTAAASRAWRPSRSDRGPSATSASGPQRGRLSERPAPACARCNRG